MLRFNVRTLLEQARARFPLELDGVTIGLPGVSVSTRVRPGEKEIAREIVIRLADRRVLNASECCDDCIDRALASLAKVRALLVDQQVALSDRTDSLLYFLLEFMLAGIRQFQTFEERLPRENRPDPQRLSHYRSPAARQAYLDALGALRHHLNRTLAAVAAIAEVDPATLQIGRMMPGQWDAELYVSGSVEP